MESLAGTKNTCDTVVAVFLEVHRAGYRDAFHPKSLVALAYQRLVDACRIGDF